MTEFGTHRRTSRRPTSPLARPLTSSCPLASPAPAVCSRACIAILADATRQAWCYRRAFTQHDAHDLLQPRSANMFDYMHGGLYTDREGSTDDPDFFERDDRRASALQLSDAKHEDGGSCRSSSLGSSSLGSLGGTPRASLDGGPEGRLDGLMHCLAASNGGRTTAFDIGPADYEPTRRAYGNGGVPQPPGGDSPTLYVRSSAGGMGGTLQKKGGTAGVTHAGADDALDPYRTTNISKPLTQMSLRRGGLPVGCGEITTDEEEAAAAAAANRGGLLHSTSPQLTPSPPPQPRTSPQRVWQQQQLQAYAQQKQQQQQQSDEPNRTLQMSTTLRASPASPMAPRGGALGVPPRPRHHSSPGTADSAALQTTGGPPGLSGGWPGATVRAVPPSSTPAGQRAHCVVEGGENDGEDFELLEEGDEATEMLECDAGAVPILDPVLNGARWRRMKQEQQAGRGVGDVEESGATAFDQLPKRAGGVHMGLRATRSQNALYPTRGSTPAGQALSPSHSQQNLSRTARCSSPGSGAAGRIPPALASPSRRVSNPGGTGVPPVSPSLRRAVPPVPPGSVLLPGAISEAGEVLPVLPPKAAAEAAAVAVERSTRALSKYTSPANRWPAATPTGIEA